MLVHSKCLNLAPRFDITDDKRQENHIWHYSRYRNRNIIRHESAVCQAVIVNRSTRIKHISEHTLTFYALAVGTVLFLCYQPTSDVSFMNGVNSLKSIINLTGLAVFPTMISMLTLAIATRLIGPTRTSVLGVFEPITAILIGTVLFLEPMTPRMLIGITFCLAAVIFISVSRHK